MRLEDVKIILVDVTAGVVSVLRQPTALIVLSGLLVGAGRFTVPGHDLTGWPGLYESLAHFWIGAMLLLIGMRTTAMIWDVDASKYARLWPDTGFVTPAEEDRRRAIVASDVAQGRAAVVWLVLLSILELVMFLRR